MERRALALIAIALAGCASTAEFSNRTPTPTPAAGTPAADLRVHFNLLLGEHVLIVAKLSAAGAAGRKEEYHAYAVLLATNGGDLADLITRSMGSGAGQQFTNVWAEGNDAAVAYVIASAVHRQSAIQAAGVKLATYASDLSGFLQSSLQLAADAGVTDLQSLIDDRAAGNLSKVYPDLHAAYTHASQLGDHIAIAIAHRFADRIPGDPADQAVTRRSSLDSLLQERSYLTTMATDATATGAGGEQTSAAMTLGSVTQQVGRLLATGAVNDLFSQDAAYLTYVSAQGDYRRNVTDLLTTTLPAQLAASIGVPATNFAEQAAATIKVIDEQRSKTYDQVAVDDRAAAVYLAGFGDVVTGASSF
jgi:hypothetical protein